MRKIDKSKILSQAYKTWEASLGEVHPLYDTQHTFYKDVVMNLFHCQNGLCAYTEMILCEEAFYRENHWKEGRYAEPKPKFFGDLEHFDSTLKKSRGWLWDNLLMAHTNINRDKSNKQVFDILKPDRADYDPYKVLAYSLLTHEFVSNEEQLTPEEQRQVDDMIELLGINHPTVVSERRSKLNQAHRAIYDYRVETWETFLAEHKAFPTALYHLKSIKEENETQTDKQ
jgi:hypothetical protein